MRSRRLTAQKKTRWSKVIASFFLCGAARRAGLGVRGEVAARGVGCGCGCRLFSAFWGCSLCLFCVLVLCFVPLFGFGGRRFWVLSRLRSRFWPLFCRPCLSCCVSPCVFGLVAVLFGLFGVGCGPVPLSPASRPCVPCLSSVALALGSSCLAVGALRPLAVEALAFLRRRFWGESCANVLKKT